LKRSRKNLGYDDLYYLCEVLKTGMSLENALELLGNDTNRDCYENILVSFSKGETIEEIFPRFLNPKVNDYFVSFIKALPFDKALSLALQFYKEEKETEEELIKNITYPFILLFVSVTALYLFDRLGMDLLMNMLKSFSDDLYIYEVIRMIIRVIACTFYFGLISVSLLALYLSRKKRLIISYEWLSRHLNNSIIKSMCSQKLISFMLIGSKNGYSTKEVLKLIRSVKSKPVLSVMAYKLDEFLMEGRSLFEAADFSLYDSLLTNYLRIATGVKDYMSILENYVELNRKKIKNTMKSLSLKLQLIIYAFIGMVIVFVYQILFLPMSAISNF